MPDFNVNIIMGRLSQEPEIRYLSTTGTALTEFTIATNRKTSSDHDEVLFLPCVCWGKLAENVSRYLTKGSGVLAKGYLRQETWKTKDGSNRSSIKMVCEDVQFLGKPNVAPQEAQKEPERPQGGHRYPTSEIPPQMRRKPPSLPSEPPPADPHVDENPQLNLDNIPF